jgi:hypothetical protein
VGVYQASGPGLHPLGMVKCSLNVQALDFRHRSFERHAGFSQSRDAVFQGFNTLVHWGSLLNSISTT